MDLQRENRKMDRRRQGNRGIEENTMAILDSCCFSISRTSEYVNDDNIAFIGAVRSSSLVPEDGSAPTNKMLEAIFQILKDGNSLELIMLSYQTLIELDQRFPRVQVSETNKSESSAASTAMLNLVVVEEAWSPFNSGSEVPTSEEQTQENFGRSFDPSGFHLLIQDIAKVVDQKSDAPKIKFLRNMLLLQYLVNVFEADFLPRNRVYSDNMNWTLLRESLLNILLGSRKINYKTLVKNCVSLICETSHVPSQYSHEKICEEISTGEQFEVFDSAVSIALPEMEKCTCIALQKLLLMIMELDKSRKIADLQGLTTRADGVRTPVIELILDELIYNEDILFSFFQVLDDPRSKLEIIIHYFRKYIFQPSLNTRRSKGSSCNVTFDGILKCLSNSSSAKSITKKMGAEVTQLLLAHAFQAYLSLSSQHSVEGIFDSKEGVEGSTIVEICKSLISAFTCLGRTIGHVGILPLGKEALFTAATILSEKS